jgi:hypothetical protein
MNANCQLHAPAVLSPSKDPPPRLYWIGGWVVPNVGLDPGEKRTILQKSNPGLLASGSSLYRLIYLDSCKYNTREYFFWVG